MTREEVARLADEDSTEAPRPRRGRRRRAQPEPETTVQTDTGTVEPAPDPLVEQARGRVRQWNADARSRTRPRRPVTHDPPRVLYAGEIANAVHQMFHLEVPDGAVMRMARTLDTRPRVLVARALDLARHKREMVKYDKARETWAATVRFLATYLEGRPDDAAPTPDPA
jgi:hypothetical protein